MSCQVVDRSRRLATFLAGLCLALALNACDPPKPLDGEKVDCVCYNLPCVRVTLAVLQTYAFRCELGAGGRLNWIPLTGADLGKVYCSECPAYRREITLCVPDGTPLPNPFTPNLNPFLGDAECRQFCGTDSDLDSTAAMSSQVPTWVSGGAGNATELPVRGWFDERKLTYQGEVVTKNRYYGGKAYGECDAPDGGGVGKVLTTGLAAAGGGVDVVGSVGPQSVVVDVSWADSYVYVMSGMSVGSSHVSGTLAYESCGESTCPLSLTSMQVAADPFKLGDHTLSGLQLTTHGAVTALPKGDGTYTVPAGSRFDVAGAIGGSRSGSAAQTKDLGLVAVAGRRFGAAFTFERDGGLMVLVLLGSARNLPPHAKLSVPSEAECSSPKGAVVTLDASASLDPDGDPLGYLFTVNGEVVANGPKSAASAQLPLGVSQVAVAVYDGKGATSTVESTVTVKDTTPPVLALAAPDLCVWPPSHDMRLFDAANLGVTVQDACDPSPSFVVASVTSDQPADALGDGHTSTDVLQGSAAFCVRSERTGTIPEGRSYEARLVATDASCNAVEQSVRVHVPHDLGATSCPAAGRRAGAVVPDGSPACAANAPANTCGGASTGALDSGGKPLVAAPQSCSTAGGALAIPVVALLPLAIRRRRSP